MLELLVDTLVINGRYVLNALNDQTSLSPAIELIGAAVLSISNADLLQTAPFEANMNHYNSNPNDTVATFAAPTKVGLNFAFSEHLSLFAEYRWLYSLSDSRTN
ncbi:hypothetical protein [Legionella antarctica]|nr:hypothetical protein [Legionella antarctica]